MTGLAPPTVFTGQAAAVVVPRGVVAASGPEALEFLQGQLSQDIAAIATGGSAWSFLLQPQGKVCAWLRITRLGDAEFLLDVDAGYAPDVLARLDRFKLRTDCTFEARDWSMVAIRGPGAAAVATPPGAWVANPEWPGIEGSDVLGPSLKAPDGCASATSGDLDRLRIMCGIPAMGLDLNDSTIPAEVGVVDRSVSFTKGCYTGQELVARIDSRGSNVARNLRGVVAEGGPAGAGLEPGANVYVGGDVVGTVTSVGIGPELSVGLAIIKRSVDTLPAQAAVNDQPVEIRLLPLV